MVETVYVAVCGLLLPFFVWGQENDNRVYPLIAFSALYGIYLLTGGLFVDSVTITIFAIALWFTASLMWSKTHQSVIELMTWISYLLLFTAARRLSLETVLYIIAPVGTIFACLQIYRQIMKLPDPWVVFGNPRHNSAFILLSMFACIGLSTITETSLGSYLSALLAVLSGIAIVMSKSKGSMLAMFIGLIVIGNVYTLLGALSIVVLTSVYLFKHRKEGKHIAGFRSSYNERLLIFLSAISMIRKSPLIGHGFRMFKKLMPDYAISLIESSQFVKTKMLNKKTGIPRNMIFSNKVHNDILELWVETGIVGVFLFVYLFTQLHYNAFSAGFLSMALVSGMFFFFLGASHTAAPFWIVMGAVAGGNHGTSTWVLRLVGIAICLYFIRLAFVKFSGFLYFSAGDLETDNIKKIKFFNKALERDPDNGDSLFMYSLNTFQSFPELSLYSFMRSLINYDGNRQIWGIWDNFSRLMLLMGNLKVSSWANLIALRYNPIYPQSLETGKLIEDRIVEITKRAKEIKEARKTKKKKR